MVDREEPTITDVVDGLTGFEPHDYVVLVIRVIETMTVPVFQSVFVAPPKSIGSISTMAVVVLLTRIITSTNNGHIIGTFGWRH